tara:strand:+ start:914 stop:1198 length:285 start_codon:yes stop_codon:yes gene_type:complete
VARLGVGWRRERTRHDDHPKRPRRLPVLDHHEPLSVALRHPHDGALPDGLPCGRLVLATEELDALLRELVRLVLVLRLREHRVAAAAAAAATAC